MLCTAPAVEGHGARREQRLTGSVVPAPRLVGSVVPAGPDGRRRFSSSWGEKLDEVTEARGRPPGPLEGMWAAF